MQVGISGAAVACASVVGLAIAWIWYSDWGLVGTTWRRLTGVRVEDSVRAGKRPFVILAVSIVLTATALDLACSAAFAVTGSRSIGTALVVGLIAWLGFSCSTLAQHNGFEQKPVPLTAINTAYQLVLFVGMAVPVGLLQQLPH